ncbi:hypothetical protein F5Y11DRAFT_124878 [Daldinia sp. FL1419]|nr:hypothetical protein F5Y11DRAFT_124878 [Daldinia sp. FL1419]
MADQPGEVFQGLLTPWEAQELVRVLNNHNSLVIQGSQDYLNNRIQVSHALRAVTHAIDMSLIPVGPPMGRVDLDPEPHQAHQQPRRASAQPLLTPNQGRVNRPKHESYWGDKLLPSLSRDEMAKAYNAADSRFYKRGPNNHQEARRNGRAYLEATVCLLWGWKRDGRQVSDAERDYLLNVCGIELTDEYMSADFENLPKMPPNELYSETFSTWCRMV